MIPGHPHSVIPGHPVIPGHLTAGQTTTAGQTSQVKETRQHVKAMTGSETEREVGSRMGRGGGGMEVGVFHPAGLSTEERVEAYLAADGGRGQAREKRKDVGKDVVPKTKTKKRRRI